MKRRIVVPVSLALALTVALAGCGDSAETSTSKTWAGTICTGADDLRVALSDAVGATDSARKLDSLAAMKQAISGPTTQIQKSIEKLDEAFSSTDILGTPLEIARNSIGKQLTQVFPLYDAIDTANSALAAAKDASAGATAVSTLNNSLAMGLPSVASLNVSIAGFKVNQDKVIKSAFVDAPECKKIK